MAFEVAERLMAHDALGMHAREELGIYDMTAARPVQAAMASAATFAVGAGLPLVAAIVSPTSVQLPVVITTSIVFLSSLGALGAYAGGAPMGKAALRVTFWGIIAMALTAMIGSLFGTTV